MKYTRYPRYRATGVEWIGDMPEGWSLKPLKRAAAINPDVLSEETEPDYEIDYVDIGDVSQIGGIGSSSRMPFSAAPSRARRRVRHGDTVLSTVRTYLKAVAYIESPPENRIVSTGFACLRPARTFSPKFLSRCVQADEFIGLVVSRSVGVSYPAISPTVLGSIPVPCPPLPEQEAITAFLDAKTAEIDALIAKKERLLELLKEKRTALITRLVTQGLDSSAPMKASGVPWAPTIPSYWQIRRNAYLFRERFHAGVEDLPILMVSLHTGVSDGAEAEDPRGRTRRFIEDRTAYKRVRPGDLVFNMMRAWQGAFGVAPTEGLVSPAYTVARPLDGVNGAYFAALFRTPGYMKDVERYSYGVADFRWRLYWVNFRGLCSFLPPIDEQAAIMARVDAVTAETHRLEEQVRLAIDRLREYRTALISAAVTGKIDVRKLTPTAPCQ